MKTRTTFFAVLVIGLMMSAISFAETDQTILYPANYDSTGQCTDYIVGYGQQLEPVNGNWIVTTDRDTTFINGLAFDPVRGLSEPTMLPTPTAEKALIASAEYELIEAANAAFASGGIEAAIEVYRANDHLVEGVGEAYGNIIMVSWVNSGEEEIIFVTAAEKADKELQRANTVSVTPLEHLKASLEKGYGYIFGTSLRSHIPLMHKETFRRSLKKVQQKAELDEEEKKVLPIGHKGFQRDISGN